MGLLLATLRRVLLGAAYSVVGISGVGLPDGEPTCAAIEQRSLGLCPLSSLQSDKPKVQAVTPKGWDLAAASPPHKGPWELWDKLNA